MRINTNLTAMNTFTQYTNNTNAVSSSVEKLSSGYAINSAADNAAGLAISEKMRAQIRGLDQASDNSQDAISLTQTAEGALESATDILQRMREIAVQSSSDTNNDDVDRDALQDEFEQLQAELDDISSSTTYNTKNLLDGSLSSSKTTVTSSSTYVSASGSSASAGTYTFSVSIKTLTSASTGTAATGSATTTSSLLSVSSTGAMDSSGTYYNGDYTLSSAVDDDGNITITATNSTSGAVFTATLDSTTLASTYGATSTYTLDFESSDGAGDGFTLTLASTGTDINDADALASAIDDTTVSFSGGTDDTAATYAVYANLTGAESVQLYSGDTSVNFSNGVTVSFDELVATDLAATNTTITSALQTKFGTTGSSTVTVSKTANDGLTFQVGANTGDTLTINIDACDTTTLGISAAKVSTQESAESAIDAVDDAINTVSSQRAYLGAIENRLDYKNDNLETSSENLSTAESQIRDVDMASEMTNFTNANILLQASTAMLAQANSLPQNVLSLIGG